MNLLELITQPFEYGFMVRAIVATLLAAVLCAVLSCWLVLTGWSLLGDAVSHAVLPGVVLAYALGWPFAVGASIFGVLAVAMIGGVRATSQVKEDAAIGIVFTTLFALGLVLVSVTPSQVDLNHIIFGNLLGVSPEDLVQVVGLVAVCLAVLLFKRKELTLFAFDPGHARTIGLSPRLLGSILLGVLALTCVVALQAVGVVLVVAMLVIPGATARLLSQSMSRMLWIAPSVSGFGSLVGLYLSYYLDISSGGSVVLCQGSIFALVYLVAPRVGLVWRMIARRGPRQQPLEADAPEKTAV